MSVPGQVHLPTALSARPPEPTPEHLWALFDEPEEAAKAAQSVQGRTTAAGEHLLVTMKEIHPRVGFRVQNAGGTAEVIGGATKA